MLSRRYFSTLLVLAIFSACSEPAPEQTSETMAEVVADADASLETALALGVSNARMPLPQILSAGQPTPEQADQLAESGFQHFISLRPSSEDGAGWEESHSMEFSRIPISGGNDLTRENVDAFAEALAGTEGEPTVVYCASGNRVGALMALKAHWLDGLSAEEAFDLGVEAGMTRLSGQVRELLGLEGE